MAKVTLKSGIRDIKKSSVNVVKGLLVAATRNYNQAIKTGASKTKVIQASATLLKVKKAWYSKSPSKELKNQINTLSEETKELRRQKKLAVAQRKWSKIKAQKAKEVKSLIEEATKTSEGISREEKILKWNTGYKEGRLQRLEERLRLYLVRDEEDVEKLKVIMEELNSMDVETLDDTLALIDLQDSYYDSDQEYISELNSTTIDDIYHRIIKTRTK